MSTSVRPSPPRTCISTCSLVRVHPPSTSERTLSDWMLSLVVLVLDPSLRSSVVRPLLRELVGLASPLSDLRQSGDCLRLGKASPRVPLHSGNGPMVLVLVLMMARARRGPRLVMGDYRTFQCDHEGVSVMCLRSEFEPLPICLF
jgi:hypothetical protein